MNEIKCRFCLKSFSKAFSLKIHIKKFHPDNFDTLYPVKNYNHKCDKCHKNFSHLKNLKFHEKTHHIQETGENSQQHGVSKVKCPLCKQENEKILDHFKTQHDIKIETEKFHFSSEEEFKTWKFSIEKTCNVSFVKPRGSNVIKKTNSIKTVYNCHRSGTYISKGKGLRNLKKQRSKKIDGFCPAQIEVIGNDGNYLVNYTKTHIGHDNNLRHLFLTSFERQNLAEKIAAKIPFDCILDEVHNSQHNSDLERIHLLTKKDLYNIEQAYNLHGQSLRNKSDSVSMDEWVKEMDETNDCVLFYKPQEMSSSQYPYLKQDDFVLIIMNEGQMNTLEKYGSDCICMDRTHDLNNYGFELHTLMVLDNMSEGFPVAFLISNRSDQEIITMFFSIIKLRLGIEITPNIFMSDVSDSFYNGWVSVMKPTEVRLYCSWHVDHDWRKHLSKIDSKEKQVAVYKELETLIQELDANAFSLMMEKCINNLLADDDTLEFGKYFETQYSNKVKSWAYSYRSQSEIDTNLHMEHMHMTIKDIYLRGKNLKRLDKAVHAILKIVRDKMFERYQITMETDMATEVEEIICDDEPKLVIEDCIRPSGDIVEIDFEDKKRQYIDRLLENLQSINSVEELELCKTLTAPIEPALAALRLRKGQKEVKLKFDRLPEIE